MAQKKGGINRQWIVMKRGLQKVEEVFKKLLKNRHSEEKEWLNRRENIIIFKLSEREKSESDMKKKDDAKICGTLKNISLEDQCEQ